jgi:hypothetical protein
MSSSREPLQTGTGSSDQNPKGEEILPQGCQLNRQDPGQRPGNRRGADCNSMVDYFSELYLFLRYLSGIEEFMRILQMRVEKTGAIA